MNPVVVVILLLIVALVGAGVAFLTYKNGVTNGKMSGQKETEQKYIDLGKDASNIINTAINEANAQKNQILQDANNEKAKVLEDANREKSNLLSEINRVKQLNEEELKEKKAELQEEARKLERREDALDNRSANLDKRETIIDQKETKLDQRIADVEKRNNKIEEIIAEQERQLYEISGYTTEEARKVVLAKVEEEMSLEVSNYIKDETEKAKSEASKKAQMILANAIQQYSNESISEKTVSVINLPTDEMKGRIIGREGRNIRSIEQVTGVDLIIDDTPDSVVISCFDPVRREIAKRTLEILVTDGRIQPSRIEEVFARCTKDVENEIREEGEKAVFEVGIGKIHPELVKIIGKLHFRTSYGQNVLDHSKEVAFLAGKMAAEIGCDETLAKRAGFLHDIGKATDHEQEGSHVDLGVEIATKFRENETVIDAIASHHGDKEPTTTIAVLVAAADTLSAARPGARSESLDNYIKRLEALESITNDIKGVDKSFALQAGRELRILVKPEMISDAESYKLARDVKNKIESTMSYPGTIKVTVIRETRATETAK